MKVLVRLFVLAGALGALFLGPAEAADALPAQEEEEDDDGRGEGIRGILTDRKGTRERDDDEPIEGVEITVAVQGGDTVDTVTTDEDGRYELELPGPGEYQATLETETLPEGVGLEEGDETLTFTIAPNQQRPLLFPLGARERSVASKFDQLPQLAFEGVKLGLLIAIAAVGLSLVYGTTGLVNFSHGELVTWGAIVAWFINVDHGIGLLPAAGLAMGIGALTGVLVDRVLWRPLRDYGMSLVAMMIVSIGLSLAARNVFQWIFGEQTRPYGEYVIQRGWDLGPITAAPKDLWSIAVALGALVLVATALQYTRIGKATRAVADNPDLAAASGIDVNRVILTTWGSAGALATLGGIIFAVSERVQFDMGFRLLLLMFAGITLGGLGTAYGALVGSFVVGVFVNVSTLVIPTELKNAGALAILVVVLLIRPQGILGRAERIG